jgi:hypothetical protein
MNEPLIQPEARSAAQPFLDMGARILHNAGQAFGGSFVVIPPANGGDPLEALILDPKQDPATFWTLLKTKCDLAISELDQRSRQQQAGTFGRR